VAVGDIRCTDSECRRNIMRVEGLPIVVCGEVTCTVDMLFGAGFMYDTIRYEMLF